MRKNNLTDLCIQQVLTSKTRDNNDDDVGGYDDDGNKDGNGDNAKTSKDENNVDNHQNDYVS